jgi:hypothetical protein
MKWVGDNLVRLLTEPTDELVFTFPNHKKATLLKKRRQIIKEGINMEIPENRENQELSKIAELLERSGIDPEDIERVNQVRVGTYQMVTKDEEGEAHIHDLDVTNVAYTPKQETDLTAFISQAAPTRITPSRARGTKSKERQALIVTDVQAWMGRDSEGGLHPFHDYNAIDIVQTIGKDNQPDEIIIVGDFADFPSLSKFKQEPAYQGTLNESFDEMHRILAQFRANCPDARIVLLEGNHELRLRNYVQQEAGKLMGIKRANLDELSVLDLQFLLRLDELEIDYIEGYPNGRYWLNDRLKVIHGNTVRQLGKTVVNLIRNDDTSSITGHIHRFEMAQRTIPTRYAGRLIMAASFGTLSRIDGALPSYHSSYTPDNKPTKHIEQWQHGAGWVSYNQGDRPFDIRPITINTFDDYYTSFGGKIYGQNR